MSIKEQLYAPFTNIQSRRGRGGTYDYVSWKAVADRMNESFGVGWSSEVVNQEIVGENVVVRVRVLATNPESGAIQYQEGYGGAKNDVAAEAGNPFKSAYSKAFKDACKKWGIGLYLDEDVEPSSSTSKIPTGYTGKEMGVPNTPNTTPTTEPPRVVQQMPKTPTFPVDTPEVKKNFTEPNIITPLPTNQMPAAGGLPIPPGISMKMSSGIVVKQETPGVKVVAEQEQAPPTPPPVQQTMPTPPVVNLSAGEKPMVTKAPTINNGAPESISDVQKAALHSILNINGVEYETLVTETFAANGITKTPIPSPDDLTYQEAVYVVKYGNDKFRRR